MYMLQSLAEEPSGVVLVLILHNVSTKAFQHEENVNDLKRVLATTRTKFSAIHICSPDSPLHDLMQASLTVILGKDNRTRLRLHTGSFYKCKKSLKSFGIPFDHLPISATLDSTSNLRSHRQWLISCSALENVIQDEVKRIRYANHRHYSYKEPEMMAASLVRSKFIDSPFHEDCVFGKGRSVMNHPGNVAMRLLLARKYDLHFNNRDGNESNRTVSTLKIAQEVLKTIKQGHGRFLKGCHGAYEGLLVPVDDKVALQKIRVAFRDLKARRMPKKMSKTSTRDFCLKRTRNDSMP